MRHVGRSAVGWLGADGLPDDIVDAVWPVARRAAQDAGRDPDAPGTHSEPDPLAHSRRATPKGVREEPALYVLHQIHRLEPGG